MPHTIAEQAVAATHELARLTRPAITPLDAAEIAVLTQTLTRLAAGLSQTLTQLSNYNDAANASANLQHAATAARCLVAALNTTNHDLGDTAEPDSEPEGVNFQPTKRGQISTGVDTEPMPRARQGAEVVLDLVRATFGLRARVICRCDDGPAAAVEDKRWDQVGLLWSGLAGWLRWASEDPVHGSAPGPA